MSARRTIDHRRSTPRAAPTVNAGSVARRPIPASPPGTNKAPVPKPVFPSKAVLENILAREQPHSKVLPLRDVAATLFPDINHPIYRLGNRSSTRKSRSNQNKTVFRCVFSNDGTNLGALLQGYKGFEDFLVDSFYEGIFIDERDHASIREDVKDKKNFNICVVAVGAFPDKTVSILVTTH